MTGSYSQLKGISGTGKGTRVSQVQEYLKSRGYNWKMLVKRGVSAYDKKKDETKVVKDFVYGVEFPELNVFMLGRWVKSNKSKLISWSSLDSVTGYGVPWLFDNILGEYIGKDYHVVVEGFPLTTDSKYSVDYVNQTYGVKNFIFQYFIYEDVEELQNRMLKRSGKRIKGTCWGGNSGFVRDYNSHIDSLLSNPSRSSMNVLIEKYKHSEDITCFGIKFLRMIGLRHLVDDFIEYSRETTTLRDVDNFDLNLQYLKYLEKQKALVDSV